MTKPINIFTVEKDGKQITVMEVPAETKVPASLREVYKVCAKVLQAQIHAAPAGEYQIDFPLVPARFHFYDVKCNEEFANIAVNNATYLARYIMAQIGLAAEIHRRMEAEEKEKMG